MSSKGEAIPMSKINEIETLHERLLSEIEQHLAIRRHLLTVSRNNPNSEIVMKLVDQISDLQQIVWTFQNTNLSLNAIVEQNIVSIEED